MVVGLTIDFYAPEQNSPLRPLPACTRLTMSVGEEAVDLGLVHSVYRHICTAIHSRAHNPDRCDFRVLKQRGFVMGQLALLTF